MRNLFRSILSSAFLPEWFSVQRKFLVSGSSGNALYDLEKCKVFRLNECEAAKFKQFSYRKEDLLPFLEGNKEMRLKHVNLELTARCNLRCRHCYGGRDFGRKNKELSTQEWKKIIKEIVEFNPKFILFTGGECLLRKDFAELLYFAQNLGQNVSVFSNLTKLSDSQAIALKETDSIVQFSAYGHNAKLHDSITCVKGSFERQQASLKKLKLLGVSLRGQAILMKENLSFQKQIKEHLQKMKIPIEFSIARPSGRQLAAEIPGCASCSFPKNYLEADGSPAFADLDFFAMKHFYNNCWIQRCGITAQGKLLACVFARDKAFADLKKQSFKEGYKKIRQNAAKHRCDNINGCKDCCLRYACLDCRPWAFSMVGKRLGKNPYCKELL